jgi:hypothetical protein
VITLADVKEWGGIIGAAVTAVGVIWNSLRIRSLAIKTDGLLEFRSRADRAEGRLEEQHDIRDRKAGIKPPEVTP